MRVILSVNNREEVLVMPVTPPSFSVKMPHSPDKIETVSGEELLLLTPAKLQSITLGSFFPVRDYPYLQNRDMWGMDYVDKINDWIGRKLPMRLIIEGTSINMPVTVDGSFDYDIKTDGDLWYTLPLTEVNLIGCRKQTIEEEIDMAKAEELEKRIKSLEETVNILANPMIYNYIDNNMPEWARETVQKLYDAGIIKGTGTDESGFPTLGLDDLTLRLLVIIDRALSAGAI